MTRRWNGERFPGGGLRLSPGFQSSAAPPTPIKMQTTFRCERTSAIPLVRYASTVFAFSRKL